MFKVDNLLDGSLDSKYSDKVFWFAERVLIDEINKIIEVYTYSDNLIKFDDVDLDFIDNNISEFVKIRQESSKELKNVLIASGSFLFINDKLLVTQRTADTKYDPLHWTTPAGRSDRSIYITALKETIEEIEIRDGDKLLYPDITKELVKDRENIEFYKTDSKNKKFNLKIYKTKLFLNNNLIEKKQFWALYSKNFNTLEFRLPIFAYINSIKSLEIKNPEYGTDSNLFSIEKLSKKENVPALKELLLELKQKA